MKTFFETIDDHLAMLLNVLDNISSDQLEELRVDYYGSGAIVSLDSVLQAMTKFRKVDVVLVQTQFRHLRCVELGFFLPIRITQSDYLLFKPQDDITLWPSANLQPAFLDGGSNPRSVLQDGDLDDPFLSFRLYAEGHVKRRLLKELKQLGSRDILVIKPIVDVQYERPWDASDYAQGLSAVIIPSDACAVVNDQYHTPQGMTSDV